MDLSFDSYCKNLLLIQYIQLLEIIFMRSYGNVGSKVETFLNLCRARDPVEILRVRYWYQGVSQRMRSGSAYQLEKHYEPQKFLKIDGRIQYPNKWIKYQIGKITPGRKLVRLVECENPGTERELNHPLWEVLRDGKSVFGEIDRYFERLDPYVQIASYGRSKDGAGGAKRKSAVDDNLGHRLVRLASLDALTALLLYWVESREYGRQKDSILLARFIYEALLIMGMEFIRRDMAEEMFLIFRAEVFEKTDWEDGHFDTDYDLYVHSILTLNGLLSQVEELDPQASWSEQVLAMQNLLRGKIGWDVRFAMRIELAPNWDVGPPTHQQYILWNKRHCLWRWGWRHLNRGTQGYFLDDEYSEMVRQVTE